MCNSTCICSDLSNTKSSNRKLLSRPQQLNMNFTCFLCVCFVCELLAWALTWQFQNWSSIYLWNSFISVKKLIQGRDRQSRNCSIRLWCKLSKYFSWRFNKIVNMKNFIFSWTSIVASGSSFLLHCCISKICCNIATKCHISFTFTFGIIWFKGETYEHLSFLWGQCPYFNIKWLEGFSSVFLKGLSSGFSSESLFSFSSSLVGSRSCLFNCECIFLNYKFFWRFEDGNVIIRFIRELFIYQLNFVPQILLLIILNYVLSKITCLAWNH